MMMKVSKEQKLKDEQANKLEDSIQGVKNFMEIHKGQSIEGKYWKPFLKSILSDLKCEQRKYA